MGHLETPANGAAIDVNYISQIVTEINKLNDDLGNRGRQSRVVDTVSDKVPKLKVPTSQLSFVTGRKEISSDGNSATNDVIRGTFYFNQNFLYAPVVTATPQIKATGIKNNTLGVSVVITEVYENRVDFSVIFNSDSKKTSILVNFIAVGVSTGQAV
jgi:hypothetical protein